jgi:hypothetical protein
MNSPLLALFVRSLREDTRSRATYWARAGLGCFLLLVMLLFFAGSRNWGNAPGRTFFSLVISFQITAITLMGLSYFASAVAEEKEEQTLGLLRMTDLSPLSILLGKSTSRLCGALCLLAAQFPFTIIAITFGGVSFGQIAASYCAVAAFTFLLCNLALLGSVISRGVAGAAAFSIATIGLLLALIPLLKALQLPSDYFHWNVAFGRIASGIWEATPIARLEEVLSTGYNGGAIGWQVLTNITFGIGCFLLAWAAFQRFCDREPVVASTPLRVPVAGDSKAVSVKLRPSRRPRAWKQALMWKDFYFLCGGRIGFIVRTLGYGGVLACALWELAKAGRASTFGFAYIASRLLPFIFSVDIGVMASRMFRTELRDQTLSALAVLPDTMRDIVRHKALACLFAAVPGIVCCSALHVIALFLPGGVVTGISSGGLLIVSTISGWCSHLLLVALIAWLSLYMKRGALPAGFLLTYVGNAFVTMLIMLIFGSMIFAFSSNRFSYLLWSPVVSGVLGLAVAWAFYLSGLQRLEVLAGED